MSAQWSLPLPDARRLAPMMTSHLDAVMAIEQVSYPTPWTRGNFVDSIASGYRCHCLFDAQDALLGYCVAMEGAGEVHLLNLPVAAERQGRGHARHMLDALVACGRQGGMTRLWLEVRESNPRARDLYRRYGLNEVGRRKAYYPQAPGRLSAAREDAVLMSLPLGEGAP